jgi:surfeit locus 1 family protein
VMAPAHDAMNENPPENAAPIPRGVPWITIGFGLAALLVLLGLGTWQMERLGWKESLLATIDQRTHSEPVSLAEMEQRWAADGDVDYTPVRVSGKFLHEREAHFLATWKGEAGFFVYTPLELADGRVLLVNRGFVPYEKKDQATRREGQIGGHVEIVGLGRNPLLEKPSAIVPDNDPAKNVFYWKDLAAMAAQGGQIEPLKIVPFFVDANDAPNPGGLPIGGVTLIDLPNNHLQYAITWYGLAAALIAVLGVWTWRRLAGERP